MRLPLIPTALGQSLIRFRHLVVRPLSPWQKVVYGLAAAILVLLGLIGLVLPVLPGLVFLALAAGLLARSPRGLVIGGIKSRWCNDLRASSNS